MLGRGVFSNVGELGVFSKFLMLRRARGVFSNVGERSLF